MDKFPKIIRQEVAKILNEQSGWREDFDRAIDNADGGIH